MKEKEFIERLKNIFRKFLKLSPDRRAEFLKTFDSLKQLAESEDVLEILNEIEAIFKREANQ